MVITLLKKEEVLDYIEGIIFSLFNGTLLVDGARYHHNSSYLDASLICQHGILTIEDLINKNIKTFTDEQVKLMKDYTSHANGIDSVSLSVTGLTNLYSYEDEYDPSTSYQVDFLVSSDIKAHRWTYNYGNEFVSIGSIAREMLKSIDIRLLKYIESARKSNDIEVLKDVVSKYNSLKGLANIINDEKLSIPLREMSFDGDNVIDVHSLIKKPAIKLVS